MPQDRNRATERHADNTPTWATGPTDVPAPGNDPDSRLRDLKAQLARAESTGDTDAAATARKEIEKVQKQAPRQTAAQARREAAQGDPNARTQAPQGRTPAPAKPPTGGTGAGGKATTSGTSGSAGAKPASGGDKTAGKDK
ncbi:hypothetical protein [Micromonospora aurantiaca (nom. illeg.)]|uniref:hypothetical protein n=1 Tax=Micromonospora aurantiaca (nom. illeg.) TaxID=47850 RepID=UPI003F4A5928